MGARTSGRVPLGSARWAFGGAPSRRAVPVPVSTGAGGAALMDGHCTITGGAVTGSMACRVRRRRRRRGKNAAGRDCKLRAGNAPDDVGDRLRGR